jgi:hypothetical protein
MLLTFQKGKIIWSKTFKANAQRIKQRPTDKNISEGFDSHAFLSNFWTKAWFIFCPNSVAEFIIS